MFRFRWLRRLFSDATPPSNAPKSRRPRVRPQLEVLEDRTLPAMLTVMNTNDAGANSLRDVVTNAASGDTIQFAANLKGQTITLTSGAIPITDKDLTIDGQSNNISISGNNAGRIFDITGISEVEIDNLTLEEGWADANAPHGGFGGAIYSMTPEIRSSWSVTTFP